MLSLTSYEYIRSLVSLIIHLVSVSFAVSEYQLSCSVQKTYLRLLTIGLALARASAQLQDSNIPPTGGGSYSLPLRAVSSPRHSPLSSQPEWTCVAWLCVCVFVSQD